jgi:hypothetical protein
MTRLVKDGSEYKNEVDSSCVYQKFFGSEPPAVDEFCLRSHREIQEIVDGWVNSVFENTPDGALKYLRHRMYVVGDMPILRYKGSWIKQKAMMYWEHRNGITNLQVSHIRAIARLSGTSVDPEKIKMAKKKHEENVKRTRGMPNYDKHRQAKVTS